MLKSRSISITDEDIDDKSFSVFQKMSLHNENIMITPKKRFIISLNESLLRFKPPSEALISLMGNSGDPQSPLNKKKKNQDDESEEDSSTMLGKYIKLEPNQQKSHPSGLKKEEKGGFKDFLNQKTHGANSCLGKKPILKNEESFFGDSPRFKQKKVSFASKKTVFTFNPNRMVSRKKF